MPPPDDLVELAAAFGIAHEYWDWRGRHVRVSAETLTAVLAALGVDAGGEAARRAALAERREAPWRRVLPRYVVAREGERRTLHAHVEHRAPVTVRLILEDGTERGALARTDDSAAPRRIGDRRLVRASFVVPDDLPAGYHTLVAETRGGEHTGELIVAPRCLGLPARLGTGHHWGLAAQLYSVRSRRSWGTGDLTDLADLAAWAGADHGAAFVLVNPLHAAQPVPPLEPSPYLPTTRRFFSPLYLRVEAVPEYAYLDADRQDAIRRLAERARGNPEVLDRDVAWTAKRAALALLFDVGRPPARESAFRGFCRREGGDLDDFATWCALAEAHGPDWHAWPEPLRNPGSAEVAAFAAQHAGAVDFHRWLQWLLDEQLDEAQCAARRCGMSLGVLHDLAVGVSRTGADSWSRQDVLADGMSVGAPPDAYAQTGQSWQQPPWRPDRLAELGYAPLRDLMRAVLRHAGGLRIDHVMGLFRLWWIPDGSPATEGTYVHYDHEAAIAVVMIEAQRAGAVVIGEDLGTVEPWVRDYLRERGILGTSVLWFEFDWAAGDHTPLPPERWREYCLASVTTHDLPPTAGYLAGDHVRLRHRIGLLTRSLDEELAADATERRAWLDLLRERGLLAEGADEFATTLALHRALSAAPARLRCLALTDAVGERRAQNQPGTTDEYPNWRVPLGGPDGRPVLLEDIVASARAAELADTMR